MSEIRVDTITEKTSANGVAIDGVKLKDNVVTVQGTSTTGGTIEIENTDTGGAANDYFGKLIFKGNDSSSSASGTRASVEGKVTGSFGSSQIDFLTASGGASASRIATVSPDGLSLADGNITFEGSGHGIHLGVTSATPANLLDDYEEGDFTAAWTIGTGTITLHPSYNQLTYTKVGRMVHIQGYLESSAESSASGTLRMNLPFTVDGSFTDLGERGGTSALLTLTAHNVGSHWWATINGDGANIRLYVASSATNVSDTGGTSVDGECTAYVNITYQTSS